MKQMWIDLDEGTYRVYGADQDRVFLVNVDDPTDTRTMIVDGVNRPMFYEVDA